MKDIVKQQIVWRLCSAEYRPYNNSEVLILTKGGIVHTGYYNAVSKKFYIYHGDQLDNRKENTIVAFCDWLSPLE